MLPRSMPTPGSITAIMLFEVGRLLRHYPLFNAFYAHGAAHLYEEVNIGFALDAGMVSRCR